MMNVDRPGVFKAKVSDHAVGISKNGFPQWIAEFQLVEIYDSENDVWVDCRDWDMVAKDYFCLAGGNNEVTQTHQQVKIATGWAGKTVQSLNDMDLSDLLVQIRVVEDTYNNQSRLKVNWIDKADASPVRQLNKLDSAALKALDAKYAAVFAKSASPAAPMKAPVKAPTRLAINPTPAPEAMQPAEDFPDTTEIPTPARRGRKPKLPPPPASTPKPAAIPPPPTTIAPTPSGRDWPTECDMDEAWTTINENLANANDADKVSDMWLELVDKISADLDGGEASITRKQWAEIRDEIDAKYGLPF